MRFLLFSLGWLFAGAHAHAGAALTCEEAYRAIEGRGDESAALAAELARLRSEKDARAKDEALTRLLDKLELARGRGEKGLTGPQAARIERDVADEVAVQFDAMSEAPGQEALRAKAAAARRIARFDEALRAEAELAARPAASSPLAAGAAREEKPVAELLAAQARHGDIPIRRFLADAANQFPPEYEGALARQMQGKNVVVLGAGSNLYNGYLSVQYRLSFLMGVKDTPEKGFFLFDPSFLEKNGSGEWVVKEAARKAHPNATILTSLEKLPEKSVVFALTPNSVHVDNVRQLSGNPRVLGLYVEKPIATSAAELGVLKKSVAATSTPLYFGDHYLHAGGSLEAAMGLPVPGSSTLEVTFDPTGDLTKALRENRPVLGKVTRVEGLNLQEGRGLAERPRLRLSSAGGGVGPDLQVHHTNVAHALGFEIKKVDRIEELAYSADEPGKGAFVPMAVARASRPDAAADRRVIEGTATNGAAFRFESAQFAPRAQNTLTLTGDAGKSLRVDFDTGTTEYLDAAGKKIGEIRSHGDAYLLTMHDAVESLLSGKPDAFQLPEQARSVLEAIEPPK